MDLGLLRCQQLKLYILKAGRALLSHQDQLRQILSQPAVQEAAAAHTGTLQRKHASVCEEGRRCSRKQARAASRRPTEGNIEMAPKCGSKMAAWPVNDRENRGHLAGGEGTPLSLPVDPRRGQYTQTCYSRRLSGRILDPRRGVRTSRDPPAVHRPERGPALMRR